MEHRDPTFYPPVRPVLEAGPDRCKASRRPSDETIGQALRVPLSSGVAADGPTESTPVGAAATGQ